MDFGNIKNEDLEDEDEDECFHESFDQQDCHVNRSRNEMDDGCHDHQRCVSSTLISTVFTLKWR